MTPFLPSLFRRTLPALTLAVAGLVAQAQSTPLAYRVKGPNGSATLLGSIHLGKKSFYPLPAAVEKAWKASDALAVEADASDTAAVAALAPKMILMPPDNLGKALGPETWAKVESRLQHPTFKTAFKKTGVPDMAVPMFKPWALGMTLAAIPAAELGLTPEQGVDHQFLQRAKEAQRPIVELESLAGQLDLMASMPEDVQRQSLLEGLDGIISGEATKEFSALITSWEKGDEQGLLKVGEAGAKSPGTRAFMRKLVDDRNVGMAEGIDKQMKTGKRVFVVVGALHLPGPKGVAELLRKKGYTVTRLK